MRTAYLHDAIYLFVKDGAFSVGDELPLEAGADMPRAPAEHVHPLIVGVEPVGHEDVWREAGLLLRRPSAFSIASVLRSGAK